MSDRAMPGRTAPEVQATSENSWRETHPTPHPVFYRTLGIRVDAVQIPGVLSCIDRWIAQRIRCHSISLLGMYGVTQAQHDARLQQAFNSVDLAVPDGMPLVWIGRLHGLPLARRVYGPELMLAACQYGLSKEYRHFFLGGAPGTPEKLVESLQSAYPGLRVAGALSPPFRPLSAAEDEQMLTAINAAGCDILWVGLGSPKQDLWMHEHRERLGVPVVIAVGAAFGMNSGMQKQAPVWLREHGLEWLFRLGHEPRRLWRRYLINGAQFIVWIALEFAGLRKSN